MLTEETSIASSNDTSIQENNEKSLIVLAAPSVTNEYYTPDFTAIVDYMINFAKIVSGKDEVVILVDDETLPYFEGKVPPNILIKALIDGIWMRDFAPVISTKQVKFKYSPSYQAAWETEDTDNGFKKWFSENGFHYYKTSDMVVDGGNVVDNAAGTRVIVTDRILQDNPSLTKASAKKILQEMLGVTEIAIIKQLPDDSTGHADGMAMWPTNDRILLMTEAEPIRTQNINELKSSFPNVEIIEIPDYCNDEMWRDFHSAYNVYVNSIVTDNYIYMPTFNNSHDTEMLELFQSHTNKRVVPVPSESVCKLGGSVRCFSWQVKGANKLKFKQAAIQ